MKPSEGGEHEASMGQPVVRSTTGSPPRRGIPRWSIRDRHGAPSLTQHDVLPESHRGSTASPARDADNKQKVITKTGTREAPICADEDEMALDSNSPAQQQRSVASATLVARGALKSGYLWKMGSNVPIWKRRYFVLKPITMLFYYMSERDTEPRGCIDLDLFDAVRRVGVAQEGSFTGWNRAAFELYRSGFPEGSGFMLEARGHEDWEEWVETISNSRHGKMQAEADLLKSTNKLLLDEIRGLERQVATFRGYADQRHVTVLALRDERHRSRELVSELATLAHVASTLSNEIEKCRKADSVTLVMAENDSVDGSTTGSGNLAAGDESGPLQALSSLATPATAASTQEVTARLCMTSGKQAAVGNACQSPGRQNEDTSAPASSPPEASTAAPSAVGAENSGDEIRAFEAIRKVLTEAQTELDRLGTKLQEEKKARNSAESQIKGAHDAALVAEERAARAEGMAAKARGRVSVLERNVEYLQHQQDGLRGKLCQAQKRTRVMQAQKAVLKKEVRDKWARKADLSATISRSGSIQEKDDAPRRSRSLMVAEPLPRLRSWRSMGELLKVSGADSAATNASRERSATGTMMITTPYESGGLDAVTEGGGGMRSCVSGTSLAAASDSGDTDMAEQSASETSDDDFSREAVGGLRLESSQEVKPLVDRIRLRIRRQVGEAQIPALTLPRQPRILRAVKKLSTAEEPSAIPSKSAVSAPGTAMGTTSSPSAPLPPAGGSGVGPGSAVGMGVAGIIWSGLGKGMVEKAAQGVGKHLSLWPGGAGAVGAEISNAAMSSSGAQTTQAQGAQVLSLASPRMSMSRSATSLADLQLARRALAGVTSSISERRGSTSMSDTDASAKASSFGLRSVSSASLSAVGAGARPTTPRVPDTPGIGVLPQAVSRTALIQLADLELEPNDDKKAEETHPQQANRVPLPLRPEDEYELVFKSRVIGLQFTTSADTQGVVVQGLEGYMGAAASGVPGERLRPEIGDVLESYNGMSARGKSADIVRGEIAACGRPLRMGFRSTRALAMEVPAAAAVVIESEVESEEDDWAFRDTPDAPTEKAEAIVAAGGVASVPASTCAIALGAVDASMRLHGSENPWREAVSTAPRWARS